MNATRKFSTHVGHGPGGAYLEVYTDDDGASGLGENARMGRWYGTVAECRALDPRRVTLYPMYEDAYTDAATMTGMYDR